MKCGVSVSKMVQQAEHEEKWVEEAKFGGLEQLTKHDMFGDLEEDEEDVLTMARRHQDMSLGAKEKAVEVKPIPDADQEKADRKNAFDGKEPQDRVWTF